MAVQIPGNVPVGNELIQIYEGVGERMINIGGWRGDDGAGRFLGPPLMIN